MNFRDLVDAARRRGVAKSRRPRTMHWVAGRCELSMSHLYNLINGVKGAPEWTVARIAKGLRFPYADVEKALARSRAESEVL